MDIDNFPIDLICFTQDDEKTIIQQILEEINKQWEYSIQKLLRDNKKFIQQFQKVVQQLYYDRDVEYYEKEKKKLIKVGRIHQKVIIDIEKVVYKEIQYKYKSRIHENRINQWAIPKIKEQINRTLFCQLSVSDIYVVLSEKLTLEDKINAIKTQYQNIANMFKQFQYIITKRKEKEQYQNYSYTHKSNNKFNSLNKKENQQQDKHLYYNNCDEEFEEVVPQQIEDNELNQILNMNNQLIGITKQQDNTPRPKPIIEQQPQPQNPEKVQIKNAEEPKTIKKGKFKILHQTKSSSIPNIINDSTQIKNSPNHQIKQSNQNVQKTQTQQLKNQQIDNKQQPMDEFIIKHKRITKKQQQPLILPNTQQPKQIKSLQKPENIQNNQKINISNIQIKSNLSSSLRPNNKFNQQTNKNQLTQSSGQIMNFLKTSTGVLNTHPSSLFLSAIFKQDPPKIVLPNPQLPFGLSVTYGCQKIIDKIQQSSKRI